jgi:phospholipase C
VLGSLLVPSAALAVPSARTVMAGNDTYVTASARTANYGSATTLRVDASPTMKSYLRFTLPAINGTITKAVLRLTPAADVNAAFDLRAVSNATWAEGSLTYANAPSVGKSIARSPTSLRSGVALSFDVTATIRSGIRAFALINTGSSSTILINSSEATTSSRRPALVLTINTAPSPGGPCGRLASPIPVQHVIWILMENHGYSQVVGSTAAPFENTLLEQCGLAANMHAETHPSLPNYIAATSGDTQGVADDASPAAHPLAVPSIFSQVKDLGKEWRSYQESAPANCPLTGGGVYAVRHDPAQYYTGIRDDCLNWDVPMGTTTGGNLLNDLNGDTLPAFAFLTPNLCSDTHDCSVATGDAWLSAWFAKIVASPAYQNGSTVIFLTWDEDEGAESNRIPTIVVSPSTPIGTVSHEAFTHYSMLRTTEELLGIATFLGHAADPGTASMRAAFNL